MLEFFKRWFSKKPHRTGSSQTPYVPMPEFSTPPPRPLTMLVTRIRRATVSTRPHHTRSTARPVADITAGRSGAGKTMDTHISAAIIAGVGRWAEASSAGYGIK
jgi:hypothetical protein